MELNIGDKVVFGRPNGKKDTGTIEKVNPKSYGIICSKGKKWRCSKTLCDPAPLTQDAIDFENTIDAQRASNDVGDPPLSLLGEAGAEFIDDKDEDIKEILDASRAVFNEQRETIKKLKEEADKLAKTNALLSVRDDARKIRCASLQEDNDKLKEDAKEHTEFDEAVKELVGTPIIPNIQKLKEDNDDSLDLVEAQTRAVKRKDKKIEELQEEEKKLKEQFVEEVKKLAEQFEKEVKKGLVESMSVETFKEIKELREDAKEHTEYQDATEEIIAERDEEIKRLLFINKLREEKINQLEEDGEKFCADCDPPHNCEACVKEFKKFKGCWTDRKQYLINEFMDKSGSWCEYCAFVKEYYPYEDDEIVITIADESQTQ
jgi:DNA repair exonuclease SbcCD ATPase subunit